jgi:hypothetical protein
VTGGSVARFLADAAKRTDPEAIVAGVEAARTAA